MKPFLKKIKRAYKKTRRFLLLGIFYALLRCGRFIPKSAGAAIGRAIGKACFRLLSRERNRALSHLATAFPDASPEWRRDVCRRTFVSVGLSLVETLMLPYLDANDMAGFELEGEEHLKAALAQGKGVVMLTGHTGNWEALVWYLIRWGCRGGVIAKKIKTYGYNGLVTSFRARYGVETIFQQGALRQSLRILHSGGVIGILPDQDIPKQPGVFVPFFGKPAYTPTGPALIAKASRAPIVPHFITRRDGGFLKHKIVILPALEYEHAADKEQEALMNTRTWTAVIEDWVRAHPDEWVWFHRRWRTPAPRATEGRPEGRQNP